MIPKTLGKNKTSAVYKPKTIFNKNNCPIICDIYRKLLSLSIEKSWFGCQYKEQQTKS